MHKALQVGPGAILRHYSPSEVELLVQAWLGTFAGNAAGVNTKAYLWHVFSFARFPSVSGAMALAEYQQQVASEFVVLSNNRVEAILTDTSPGWCSVADYQVFPANMAWSMSFTHEDGWLGPNFAKHTNYLEPNGTNTAKVKKARDAAAAKEKGYGNATV